MKKYFFLACLSAFALIACKKKAPVENTPAKDTTQVAQVKIDSLAFEVDTFHVVETEKDCGKGDCATFDSYYEKIRKPLLPVHDSVNRYVDSFMVSTMRGIGYDAGAFDLAKVGKNFIKMATSDEYADVGTLDWSSHSTIIRPVNEIISVSSSCGGYTGGAHGNYYIEVVNFFTSNGKLVKMENLFNDTAALNKLGLKYFKKDNQIDEKTDLEEAGWFVSDQSFYLNNNFDITMDAITWQYNPYEIGPYVMGDASVTIPMKELQKYLKVKLTDVVIQ